MLRVHSSLRLDTTVTHNEQSGTDLGGQLRQMGTSGQGGQLGEIRAEEINVLLAGRAD